MFKFNSDNIFTGYIKQLLATFNLPKYKVYTKKQADYHRDYLKNVRTLHKSHLEALNNKYEILTIEAQNFANKIDELSTELDTINHTSEIAEQEALIEELAEKIENINTEIAQWTSEKAELDPTDDAEEIAEIDAKISRKQQEKNTYAGQSVTAQETITALEADAALATNVAKAEALEAEINDANTQLSAIRANERATSQEITKEEKIKPELNVLESCYRDTTVTYQTARAEVGETYPRYLRYIPYIRNNEIQIYAPKITDDGKVFYADNDDIDWKNCHAAFGSEHKPTHKRNENLVTPKYYTYNMKIRNGTKNLVIQNNTYDTYTHEYLGDFLRFHRDYRNLDLMSLYNCFSNNVCPELNLKVQVSTDAGNARLGLNTKGYIAEFKTSDQNYKIYMVPVKLFQEYTIAMDSETAIELCCGLFNQYQYDKEYDIIAESTYTCYNSMQFNDPKLFTAISNLNDLTTLLDATELAQHEGDLKLFIKVPINNKSSIVILEGNYLGYNDAAVLKVKANPDKVNSKEINKKFVNYSVINFEGSLDKLTNLITPLQLLMANTGESYPFADRLLEYLVGNAITKDDPIGDNVKRAKMVVKENVDQSIVKVIGDEIWIPALKYVFYSYINKNYNSKDFNHDILGYVDKDIEKFYSYTVSRRKFINGQFKTEKQSRSISAINIYDEWATEDEEEWTVVNGEE